MKRASTFGDKIWYDVDILITKGMGNKHDNSFSKCRSPYLFPVERCK